GTTEVLGVMSVEPAAADGLLTVDWGGLSQLGGPSLNGADTMTWLMSLLGHDDGAIDMTIEALLSTPRQPQPLLFLPYLQGERVPFWDASLRGAFIGLGRQHGAIDLVWAVMEGIGFLNREVLERAETAVGTKVSVIRFGGGGAANPVWCQIKADICGRPVETCSAAEPGVLGAAAVAWTGLGRFASLAEAQQRLVSVKRRFEPDPAKAEHYRSLFMQFQLGGQALAPISRVLAGIAPT
ncbi:MAG: xylulokinase, partial [Bosea sp. (in: a-proteobacteria)]